MSKWLPVFVLAASLLCKACLAGDLCVLGGVSGLSLPVFLACVSACLPACLPACLVILFLTGYNMML